jgi:hypothetical protein
MNERTIRKLDELRSIRLFANVSKHIEGDFQTVGGWNDAVKLGTSEKWQSVRLQIKNQIAEEVTKRDYWRSTEWNPVAEEVKNEVETFLAATIEPNEALVHLGQRFRNTVAWDMLMICMEAEFSDLITPMFYVPRLQPIYAAGHFPCDWAGPKLGNFWNGKLEAWKLIVY